MLLVVSSAFHRKRRMGWLIGVAAAMPSLLSSSSAGAVVVVVVVVGHGAVLTEPMTMFLWFGGKEPYMHGKATNGSSSSVQK